MRGAFFLKKKICACCALLMRLPWCFSIWCMFPLSIGVRAAPPTSLNRLCWRGIPLGACCFLFQICSLFLKNLNGPWWSPSFSQSGSLHYSHAWWMPLSENSGASPLSKSLHVFVFLVSSPQFHLVHPPIIPCSSFLKLISQIFKNLP